MNSGDLFLKGDALFGDGMYEESFASFMLGAEQGNVSCMTRIGSMYGCGEGVECDYDEAIKWELKAASLGEVSAMVNVGISYRMKGDIKKAKQWFENAVSAGDGSGAIELAKLYMVSEKETERVKKYLNVAINSENMCESEIEEAKQYLLEIVV